MLVPNGLEGIDADQKNRLGNLSCPFPSACAMPCRMDEKATQTPLDVLVAALHAQPRLRVWSLVVTFLGDAIVPRGGRAALTQIQAVMDRLAIDAGAVRTAMSRLASDGWVTREKEGRLAFYRLAAEGRHAFDEATRRIYASGPPAWNGQWSVLVGTPDLSDLRAGALAENGYLRIAPTVFLRPDATGLKDEAGLADRMLAISGTGSPMPADLAALWASDALAESYRRFIRVWSPLADALSQGVKLAPLDAMAARTLLVHDWRRLVLRDACLPEVMMPADWPGGQSRTLARRIYAPLVAPSEDWLTGEGVAPQRDPLAFAQRFGIQPAITHSID